MRFLYNIHLVSVVWLYSEAHRSSSYRETTPGRGASKARILYIRANARPNDRLLVISLTEVLYLLSALWVGKLETCEPLKGLALTAIDLNGKRITVAEPEGASRMPRSPSAAFRITFAISSTLLEDSRDDLGGSSAK